MEWQVCLTIQTIGLQKKKTHKESNIGISHVMKGNWFVEVWEGFYFSIEDNKQSKTFSKRLGSIGPGPISDGKG